MQMCITALSLHYHSISKMKNSSSFVIIVRVLVENVGVGHSKGVIDTRRLAKNWLALQVNAPRPYSIIPARMIGKSISSLTTFNA